MTILLDESLIEELTVEARRYCTRNKKKTYRKVITMIFSDRFWLSFIGFVDYNKY